MSSKDLKPKIRLGQSVGGRRRAMAVWTIIALAGGAGAYAAYRYTGTTTVEVPVAKVRKGEFIISVKTRGEVKSAKSVVIAAPQVPDLKIEANKSVPSIISADLNIEGNLVSSGEIQVDGNVHGDIRCKVLIVGIKGQVTGEVNAQTVRMHGAIKGTVRAKSVFLASTARMAGDVEHESLAIEPGAYMEGHCKRITDSGGLAPVLDVRRTDLSPRLATGGAKTALAAG